jgi:hypothetical protein
MVLQHPGGSICLFCSLVLDKRVLSMSTNGFERVRGELWIGKYKRNTHAFGLSGKDNRISNTTITVEERFSQCSLPLRFAERFMLAFTDESGYRFRFMCRLLCHRIVICGDCSLLDHDWHFCLDFNKGCGDVLQSAGDLLPCLSLETAFVRF